MQNGHIQSAKTELDKRKNRATQRQTARSQATSRPREQEQRLALFYAFLPFDI